MKPPTAHQTVLKRVAELTNIVLAQSQTITELKDIVIASKEASNEITKSLSELRAQQAASNVMNQRRFSREFPTGSSLAHSRDSSDLLGIPHLGARARSGSLKRRREENDEASEFIIGTSSSAEFAIPVAPKSERSRVFVSRVSANFTAEQLHSSIRPRLTMPLSVVRMATTHAQCASFVLNVHETDACTLLNPAFWSTGTLVRTFRGRLHRSQVHSTFGDVGDVFDPVTLPSTASNTAMEVTQSKN